MVGGRDLPSPGVKGGRLELLPVGGQSRASQPFYGGSGRTMEPTRQRGAGVPGCSVGGEGGSGVAARRSQDRWTGGRHGSASGCGAGVRGPTRKEGSPPAYAIRAHHDRRRGAGELVLPSAPGPASHGGAGPGGSSASRSRSSLPGKLLGAGAPGAQGKRPDRNAQFWTRTVSLRWLAFPRESNAVTVIR